MAAPATIRALRRRPPEATLAWVADRVAPGATIGGVRALGHATSRAVHAVNLVSPAGDVTRVVLRRFVPTPETALDPDMNVTRELAVLQLLSDGEIPAPRALAADPDATATDVPAIVHNRLPGSPPGGLPELEQLFAALAKIHGLDGQAVVALPRHRRWNDPSTTGVPPWARDPSLWRAAIDIARGSAPAAEAAVVHGDLHLANTLWSKDRLTGIVDWTQASFGPPAVDLAQLRWNLAVDHGVEVAAETLRLAKRWGLAHQPYWDVANVVDLLADISPSRPPQPLPLARLEAFLRSAVDACASSS